jgi:hypothetical protein
MSWTSCGGVQTTDTGVGSVVSPDSSGEASPAHRCRAASRPAMSVVSVAQATTPSGRSTQALAGGVAPQAAVWAIDALLLYVAATGSTSPSP